MKFGNMTDNMIFEDLQKHCFDRTQIDTDYRIVCCSHSCNCVRCSENEKETLKYFQIFLIADNHNFDQPIIHTCDLRKIFPDRIVELDQIINIIKLVCDKENYKLERYFKGRDGAYCIFTGRNILIAKDCLTIILKGLYNYGTESNFKNINNPITFFESTQSNNE
jgi:hypothetical protein